VLSETHQVVVGAGPGGCFAPVSPRPAAVVQVLVVEQLLGVDADGGAHVQTQLLLQELPLAGQTFFRVNLT